MGKGEPTTHTDTALHTLTPNLYPLWSEAHQLRLLKGVLESLGSVPFIPLLCPSAIPERRMVAAIGMVPVSETLSCSLCLTSQEPMELHLLQDEGVFRKSAVCQGI